MITQLTHFCLPNTDIELLEREFQCQIRHNPINGWWQIHATSEDTPIILAWVNALKTQSTPKNTL
jgi:hypothetical protein